MRLMLLYSYLCLDCILLYYTIKLGGVTRVGERGRLLSKILPRLLFAFPTFKEIKINTFCYANILYYCELKISITTNQ